MIAKIQRAFLLCAFSTLAGCVVGPDYQRPEVNMPTQFKEFAEWKLAEPRDDAPRGHWWKIYGDSQLDALAAQVEISNQNVRAAEAQYRQAQATLATARSSYFPTVSGSFSTNRGQSASTTSGTENNVHNTDRLSLNATWEADIWGRISRSVESNTASAQASAADLQAALLSAQATLVQTYIQLRVNEAQRRLLEETVKAYESSLKITRNRYTTGIASRIDVAQAETQLRSTQAQVIDLGVQRAQLEHAIALLIGKPPADFTLSPNGMLPALPQIPGDIPSSLLERRPDVAAAERRAAAANAQIGIAQAAFFPTLNLTASGGYQGSSLSQLTTLPNRLWSLGPVLALSLFDAGARSAQKELAIATYDKSVATYRQSVLTAFQDVEDSLVSLRILSDEAEVQHEAAQFAAESLRLTNNQYQSGTVSYLNVVIAQATALSADRSSLDIAARRLLASTALIKALGGNWRTPPPT